MPRFTAENSLTIASVLIGLVVAGALAPKDAGFLPNALFFWLPHVGILGVVLLLRPRLASLAGVALALALYLAAFGVWVFSSTPRESMAWLGYIFSLPGALLAAIWVTLNQKAHPQSSVPTMAALAASAVLFGIALNQVLICSTLMQCRWPR